MNAEAENCLLKTLEEPPAASVLILLTSNIQVPAANDPFPMPNSPISSDAYAGISSGFNR